MGRVWAVRRVKLVDADQGHAGRGRAGSCPIRSSPYASRTSRNATFAWSQFFCGLGELAEFLKESALAVLEVAFGRWPKPYDDRSRLDRDKTNISAAAAAPAAFQTTWFLESMATQILVIFVIRTNGRPWKDLPRPLLAASSLGALVVAMVLPFTPAARLFGFQAPPLAITGGVGLLVVVYLVCAELLKQVAVGPSFKRALA